MLENEFQETRKKRIIGKREKLSKVKGTEVHHRKRRKSERQIRRKGTESAKKERLKIESENDEGKERNILKSICSLTYNSIPADRYIDMN